MLDLLSVIYDFEEKKKAYLNSFSDYFLLIPPKRLTNTLPR